MNLADSLQGLPDLASRPGVQRALRYLPGVITALLVVILGNQLARLTWMLIPTSTADANIVIAPSTPAQRAGNRINTQRIADAHLFGMATASTDPSDAANAPVTQMPLVLAGVMATPDPAKGFAFIGESAPAAKFKRVGDPVPGGATLHSVYLDRVMLDRGGRLEALLMPRAASFGAPPPAAAARPPGVPTRFAQGVQRMMESNPAAFSEIVRVQMRYDKGSLSGVAVFPGRNRQQFTRLGLQPNDLVTSVNGQPLTDQATARQIFDTISSADQVTLGIIRNGQPQQISVNTAQIELPDPSAHGASPQDSPPPVSTAPAAQ